MHNEIQIKKNTANQTYIKTKKLNPSMLSKVTKKKFHICF